MPVAPANIDEADIYFDGKYTRVVDEGAAFDIDTYAGYMRAIEPDSPGYWGRAGVYGQMRARDSSNADPDSLLLYGVYQRVLGTGRFYGPLQSPILNLSRARLRDRAQRRPAQLHRQPGGDRAGAALVAARSDRFNRGSSIPQMTVFAGAEIVKPFAERQRHGNRLASRGRCSARRSTAGIAPEQPWLQSLDAEGGVSAALAVRRRRSSKIRRAPSSPRPASAAGPSSSSAASRATAPRCRSPTFPVKWTGLSFEYEHGGVPPVFVISRPHVHGRHHLHAQADQLRPPFDPRAVRCRVRDSVDWSSNARRLWLGSDSRRGHVRSYSDGLHCGSTGVGLSNQISIS